MNSPRDVETQEDHEVVGQEAEGGFTVPAVIASGGEGGGAVSLDHAEDGLICRRGP